jgi:Predicted membrane protein (DUF2232)
MDFKRLGKLAAFLGVSVFFAGFPMLLAAPVVRVARAAFAPTLFWSSYVLMSIVLWFVGLQPIAIGMITLTLLVGLFYELEKRTRNMFIAGAVAVAAASVVSVSATQQWLSSQGTSLESKVREQISVVVDETKKLSASSELDTETLLSQVPSGLIGFMILALAVSLILERPVRLLFKETSGVEPRLLRAFKLPDLFIWIAMFSFLLSFLELNNKMLTVVASNIFNVMVVLYFFQGLAVVESLFRAIRMGPFLRVAIYLVLVIQLFVLVAAVGLIDYWVDIRNRLIKRRQPSA